ncbi:hypothetical protein INR49_021056 [Caranx melampygus]|nr:hypothetical protein INR49_021056 [Caranx melampygus]
MREPQEEEKKKACPKRGEEGPRLGEPGWHSSCQHSPHVVRPRAPQTVGPSQRRGLATGGLTEPPASPHFLLFLPVQTGFRRSFRLSRRDKKTNKSMYECKKSEMYDMADVPTYEEVTPYRRQSGGRHRLVVLVGQTVEQDQRALLLLVKSLMVGLSGPLAAAGTAGTGFNRRLRCSEERLLPCSIDITSGEQGSDVQGPTGVGLNELKRKLLIADPQHFSVTIPHRLRPFALVKPLVRLSTQTNTLETHSQRNSSFHSVRRRLCSRGDEAQIWAWFIEYGEYKGNYYGTSLDAVRSVLSRNKVCLLDVQPHTIKHLRTTEFKPYVVFVKPPAIDRLRETRKNARIISGKDDKGSAKPFTTPVPARCSAAFIWSKSSFTPPYLVSTSGSQESLLTSASRLQPEEDFQEMANTALSMETQYGHLFEKVIVNDDLSAAFSELRTALKKIETETQWVPVSWTHS